MFKGYHKIYNAIKTLFPAIFFPSKIHYFWTRNRPSFAPFLKFV